MKKLIAFYFSVFCFFGLGMGTAYASSIFYAETTGFLETASGTPVDLPGLSVTIPSWSNRSDTALVTVNIPNPYAVGTNFPGGLFQVAVNGVIQKAISTFTYTQQVPASFARVPATLVTKVTLPTNQIATIQVKWSGIRGSTVRVDSPTALSVQLF